MFKKATLTLGLLVLLTPAFAQQRNPKPPKPEKPPKPAPVAPVRNDQATIDRLRKLLRLSDDQVFKLRPIVADRNQQLTEAFEQNSNARDRKAQSDSIQQHFEGDVRAILTPSQVDKFDHEVLVHPGSFR